MMDAGSLGSAIAATIIFLVAVAFVVGAAVASLIWWLV